MTSRKQVKIHVYWKDEKCSTWAECWIGGAGKDNNGAVNRPIKTLEMLLDFAWKYGWISPQYTIEHAFFWIWNRGKVQKMGEKNGV